MDMERWEEMKLQDRCQVDRKRERIRDDDDGDRPQGPGRRRTKRLRYEMIGDNWGEDKMMVGETGDEWGEMSAVRKDDAQEPPANHNSVIRRGIVDTPSLHKVRSSLITEYFSPRTMAGKEDMNITWDTGTWSRMMKDGWMICT